MTADIEELGVVNEGFRRAENRFALGVGPEMHALRRSATVGAWSDKSSRSFRLAYDPRAMFDRRPAVDSEGCVRLCGELLVRPDSVSVRESSTQGRMQSDNIYRRARRGAGRRGGCGRT
jgi:hypothetical protein